MEKIATENLFLLEFLVDNVKLESKCECDSPPGETCVSFQFLDNFPLDVCEGDFSPKRNIKNDDSVKSGKSCLFSLSPEQAQQATEQFDISVCVKKKMQPGWLPEKVELGSALISVSNLFNELICCVEMSDGSTPTAKTLKDVFDINDNTCNTIGQISVYIRMSCFGKLIVTQFQMNLDDKSVLFKDKEGKSLYRYKKAGKGRRDICGGAQGVKKSPQGSGHNNNCPETQCFLGSPGGRGYAVQPTLSCNSENIGECPFGPCPLNKPQRQPSISQCPAGQMGYPMGGFDSGMGMGGMSFTPCNECGGMQAAPCIPSTGMGGGFNAMGMGMGGNIVQQGCAPPTDENYQEIGASMGGNTLTIRVHKDKNKIEAVDNSQDCSCDGRPIAASRTSCGSAPRKQAFAGRPNANANPFSFRMGQFGDNRVGDNNIVVNPPVCTAPDGTQFTEFSDPNKEMFILRIGKKSEGVEKKSNLELELQTPKIPPIKPIPKTETIETQCDPLDCVAEVVAKQKKGDKKGKKKGKKKGGKGKPKGKGKKK